MEQLTLNRNIKPKITNLEKDSCPNCGFNQLHRIKRKNFHKILSITLLGTVSFKRYACARCEWKGVKLD